MRAIAIISVAGAIIGLGFASAAQAQPALPPPAVKSGPPSIDWPIQDLMADPVLDAALNKDMPDLATSEYLEIIKPLSIRSIAAFPQANLDQAKLDQIQADLTAAAANDPALQGGK